MKVNKFRAFTLVLILALVSLSFLNIPNANMGHAESIQTINLINNGSFESGTNTNFFGNKYYVPTNWSSYSDFCVHEDKTLAYEGSKSIKIDSIGDGFYLQTSNDLQAKGDTCYRIGYMVRATDVSETSFGLTVTSLDDSGKVVETFTIEGICLKTAEEWQEISLYAGMQSTVNSVSIKLDVDYSGANGCNIDAVFMEEISCVKINDGASVRKTKDSPGLRFSGTVDKYTYDLFNDSYKNVSAGIVIFPKVYYEKISNFTFYDIDKSGLDYLDIEAVIWNNVATAQTDGFYGFNCVMVDIKQAHIVHQFCARAYLRYQDGDVIKYIYSDFDIEKNCRSVQEVAKAEIEVNGEYLTYEDLYTLEYFANGGNSQSE